MENYISSSTSKVKGSGVQYMAQCPAISRYWFIQSRPGPIKCVNGISQWLVVRPIREEIGKLYFNRFLKNICRDISGARDGQAKANDRLRGGNIVDLSASSNFKFKFGPEGAARARKRKRSSSSKWCPRGVNKMAAVSFPTRFKCLLNIILK